jgi:hypothetical protein
VANWPDFGLNIFGLAPVFSEIAGNHDFLPILGQKSPKNISKSLVRNRNSPDILTVTFYERHLWAGLLGWPD